MSRLTRALGRGGWMEVIYVALLTGAGAGLRVFHLGASSLWLDELFSVFVARRDWAGIVAATAADSEPPLYYFLLHSALLAGSDESAARFVSLFFSVLAIPMVYLLARDWFGSRAALVAAALVVLSPFQVLFAQEARMYGLLLFLLSAAVWFFTRAWRHSRPMDWLFFVLAMDLALYTHNLAILTLLALDAAVVFQPAAWRLRARELIITHLAILVLFGPWLAILPAQAAGVMTGYWIADPSVANLLLTPYLFLLSNNVPVLLVPFALFCVLALVGFAIAAAVRVMVSKQEEGTSVLFASLVFALPVIVLFAISLVRPMFVQRTLIGSTAGLYPLLGWTIVQAKPRILNVGLGVATILLMVVGLYNYYFNPAMQKPPMREAAAVLMQDYREGDAIAHTSDSSALAFAYYRPEWRNAFLAGDPDFVAGTRRGVAGRILGLQPVELDTVTRAHTRLWLVVALDHNEEYQRERVRQADQLYTRTLHKTLGGIDLLLYEVPQ